MNWKVCATVLTAVTIITWFPNTSSAQDGSASSGKVPSLESHHAPPVVPYRPSQISQEFLSRLFPVKGRMYGDRNARPTRDWTSQTSRPIEQFQDKEFAQQTCWNICISFMARNDQTSLKNILDFKNSGVAFVYFPPDDFDRQRWGGGGNNPDRLGRHILSFKRNDIYVTVVIQEDMIAFTFEYKVDPKEPEPPLEEIQNKIAAICPFLENLVLEKLPPEEDVIGLTKAGLGKAKAKGQQRFTEEWIRSILWWREPGRFGISSTIMPYDTQTGRIYRAPYTGN